MKSVPTDQAEVKAATEAAVRQLNKLVEPYSNICEHWTLKSIESAQVNSESSGNYNSDLHFIDYVIMFTVEPISARFEATVRKLTQSAEYRVEGSIGRISLYGNTSHCITDSREMKNYCYCKNQRIKDVTSRT